MLAALAVTGCSSVPPVASDSALGDYATLEPPSAGADIALVTTSGMLEGEFAQSALAAITKYAGENELTSGVYRAEGGGEEAVLANLELAAKGGAKLVVLLGPELTATALPAQEQYPDINFILLGMAPDVQTLSNGVRVVFSPEQGGWLAGYTAVWEGYATLGWLGDGSIPGTDTAANDISLRGGLGFLLGAEAAAREMGLEPGSILALSPLLPDGRPDTPVDTSASGADSSDPSAPASEPDAAPEAGAPEQDADPGSERVQEMAADLYERGAALIFANLPGYQNDARLASDAAGGEYIGFSLYAEADAATGAPTDTAFVNVKYEPADILQSLLESWHSDRFPGGGVGLATVANSGVGLDMARATKLTNLTETRYEGLLDDIRFGTLEMDISRALSSLSLGSIITAEELPLTIVSLAPIAPPGDGSSSQSE